VTTELKDKSGFLIGKIHDLANYLELRDKQGYVKGRYSKSTNETRDHSGMLVGKGNLLSMLLSAN
jgi:hypothetical protein